MNIVQTYNKKDETIAHDKRYIARKKMNKHDELLLKDLKLQPKIIIYFYLLIGIIASIVGLYISDFSLTSILTLLGGALIALGAEKLVSLRLRAILVEIADKRT